MPLSGGAHKGATLLRRHRCAVSCVLIALALLYVWDVLIKAHGTLAPWYVWTHVAQYSGPMDAPPAAWQAPFRVVVSLSTRPDRMDSLIPTLRTVLQQDMPAQAVYVNVPTGINARTGQEYVIPDSLRALEGVTLLRCHDTGPLTKLLPTLEYETDPETLVVTVDDDKLYPPHLLRTLAWHAAHTSNIAISSCGWSFMWWPSHWVSVYVPYWMRSGAGVFVDVLQGVCGVAYRRKFFNTAELRDVPSSCFTIDDEWIAGYLATHGVRRAIISTRLDPAERHDLTSATRQFSLSFSNSKNLDRYDMCLLQVGDRFSPWHRVSEWQGNHPAPTPLANVTIPLPYDAGVYVEPEHRQL